MTPSLIANGLIKRFRTHTAVDNLSIEIHTGEVVGLLGPNGAGKTTAFKLILGLLKPDAGTVSFGTPLDNLPLYRRARLGLGYLPQGPSVFHGLSVRENLTALLEALGNNDAPGRADALLERFGLIKNRDQRASTLSGGERRRLEFARALASSPSILLCDEPFAGVDPIAAQEIARTIEELKELKVGVLLTDHNVRGALAVCDRVYLIANGRIAEHGRPEEILASENARALYLGTDFDMGG